MKPTDKPSKNSPGKPEDYSRLLSEIKEHILAAQYEALKALEYHVTKASNPRFLTMLSRRSDGPLGFLIPLSQSETRFLETFK